MAIWLEAPRLEEMDSHHLRAYRESVRAMLESRTDLSPRAARRLLRDIIAAATILTERGER